MKKIYNILAACAIAACTTATVNAADPGYASDTDFSDMALINCGDNAKRAIWTEEDFLPYVTHTYADGHEDWFFDCFLLVDTHHGTKIFGNDASGTPGNKSDWNWMLNQFFDPQLKLRALDNLIEKKKQTLGNPPLKHHVVLSLCLPCVAKEDGKWTRTAWGRLDRLNINFLTLNNRLNAVKWYIDEVVRRFEAEGYKNLTLAGVYWVEEGIWTNRDLALKVNNYVHEKGLKSYWIPYYKDNISSWSVGTSSYKFDLTYIQPNYAFYMNGNKLYSKSILKECCDAARKYGLGLEFEMETIEASSCMYDKNPIIYQRILDYLDAFEEYGVVAEAGIAYYTGSQGLIDMANSTNPMDHALVDRIASIVSRRQNARTGGIAGVTVDHVQLAYPGAGCIVFSENDPGMCCYDISGRLVHSGSGRYDCPAGIYFVKSTDGRSQKIQVK